MRDSIYQNILFQFTTILQTLRTETAISITTYRAMVRSLTGIRMEAVREVIIVQEVVIQDDITVQSSIIQNVFTVHWCLIQEVITVHQSRIRKAIMQRLMLHMEVADIKSIKYLLLLMTGVIFSKNTCLQIFNSFIQINSA